MAELHPNHLPDLRYALDALKLAREAIEPLTEAQIKLHRIKRDTADRIEAAIVGMRYIIKRTEEAASSPSIEREVSGEASAEGVPGAALDPESWPSAALDEARAACVTPCDGGKNG